MKRGLFHIVCCLLALNLSGQDPHFSQFFMAPYLLNPATAGTGSGDWRVSTNIRQQWGNAGTPFTTMTVSGDNKFSGKDAYENTLAGSLTLMGDQSMNGAFKSAYASAALAYHLQLADQHRLGLGLEASFGNRWLDYSQLNFGEQFTSGGFDLTLPTGETGLSNMKPFVSAGAGLLYNFQSDNMSMDLGAAAFHLNKPAQTFVGDPKQHIPVRYVAHASFEFSLSDQLLLDFNGAYQQQSVQSYFALGGCGGFDLTQGRRENILFAGAWWRQGDAIYPYLGLLYGNVQVGFSYDITASKQNKGPMMPRSFEFSLVIRQVKKIPGVIACPWK